MSSPASRDQRPASPSDTRSWAQVPTRTVTVDGVDFAYRTYGPGGGVPVVFLHHLGANLDNWDPRVVDGIAAHHHVVAFDNRGVGATGGTTSTTVEAMADDAIAVIEALGFDTVDLFGFSLGGFVAQVIAAVRPDLIRRLVLTGTGPAGGEGIADVSRVTYSDSIKAILSGKDPKTRLFFTRTDNGRAQAAAFLRRLKERTEDRDEAVSLRTFRNQLTAIHAWGTQTPADLSAITAPTLVANGDGDRMVPTSNSFDLARRIPDAELRIYHDAGHGGIFQAHDEFVPTLLEFLAS